MCPTLRFVKITKIILKTYPALIIHQKHYQSCSGAEIEQSKGNPLIFISFYVSALSGIVDFYNSYL